MNARAISFPVLVLMFIGSFSRATAQVVFPDPVLNDVVRQMLQKPTGPLTEQDLLGLTNLTAISRGISNLQGLGAARNLQTLVLDDNHLTNSSFSNELANLTSLTVLDLSENSFTDLPLPAGLTNLTKLRLENGKLTHFDLLGGLTSLRELYLGFNHLSNLTVPEDATNLSVLSVYQNQLTNLTLPQNLQNLSQLNLDGNQLSHLVLPSGLTKLVALMLGNNQLARFAVPADMTNLQVLRMNDNPITNLTLPMGLEHLSFLYLPRTQFRTLSLPAGLTNLTALDLTDSQLTSLTLPPDMTQLFEFFVGGNPLTTFVVPEPLASAGLASVVDSLRNRGVSVFTYPVTVELVGPHALIGAFEFGITGPPGTYSVLGTTNLSAWMVVGTVKNPLGSVHFTDVPAQSAPQRFYRALLQSPPTNMVYVPPNTFTMGSLSNDFDRSIFEGPPTTVTLTRGFWIGKYEVTQGEYLEVVGENPSNFPGDLRRPVSSVSWFDATNYCDKLTKRELAAGRISPGSVYRLPTEAEWECAARAGTSTRFSYGDDPTYGSLTNYAWFLDLGHPDLTIHPVGQKLPNPWGLYDMAGSVWEWCQDWYGDQLGGVQTDPTGPLSNPLGNKVMRGGAYDYPNSSCRSASRLFFFALFPDTDLDFRVVLSTDL